MFDFDSINIILNGNVITLILAAVILIIFTVFIYKITVPQVTRMKKIILVSIRSFTLVMILLLIFEPIVRINTIKIEEPKNLIYIDNSQSIKLADSIIAYESLPKLYEYLVNNLEGENSIFLFGGSVQNINGNDLNKINYSEKLSNIENVIKNSKSAVENISSIVLITDGIFNYGADAINDAKHLGIPIYAIGVGDTNAYNDISIKKVLNNEFIYLGKETSIQAVILNNGYANENVLVSLRDGNEIIQQVTVLLSNSGLNRVEFTYVPDTHGEKRLSISVAPMKDEESITNNSHTFYVNVLNNKLRVTLICGKPSADLQFIKNALSRDENLQIESIIYTDKSKLLNGTDPLIVIDSTDIFFLINYLTTAIPGEISKAINSQIQSGNKPFFLLFTHSIERNDFSLVAELLPFEIIRYSNNKLLVQPHIIANNSLFALNGKQDLTAWNSLPPVISTDSRIKAKPGSEIIAFKKIKNLPADNPLIITNSVGDRRSIILFASEIWRWRLQNFNDDNSIFDTFFKNCVQWLNVNSDRKQFSIKPIKRNFKRGEPIEITAELYDESFEPINNIEVKIHLSTGNESNEYFLRSIGNGLYEGTIASNFINDVLVKGLVNLNGKILQDQKIITVEDINSEELDLVMKKNYLRQLAFQTGGMFKFIGDEDKIVQKINSLNKNRSGEKKDFVEFRIWSSEWFLMLIILFFGIEWFIRKRTGML